MPRSHTCPTCFNVQAQRCDNSSTACCWCRDKRSESQAHTRYVDGYDAVNTAEFETVFPRDMYYCPKCRHDKTSSAEYDQRIRQELHRRYPDGPPDSDDDDGPNDGWSLAPKPVNLHEVIDLRLFATKYPGSREVTPHTKHSYNLRTRR